MARILIYKESALFYCGRGGKISPAYQGIKPGIERDIMKFGSCFSICVYDLFLVQQYFSAVGSRQSTVCIDDCAINNDRFNSFAYLIRMGIIGGIL